MSTPGIRRSGRARTQVHSLYDKAREHAQKEEDERSVASSESKSPSPRRRSKSAGAAGKAKAKAKQQQQRRQQEDEVEEEESSDDDGSVASGAGKKRKRAPPAAKGKGKGRKAPTKKAAAAAEESSDSDDDSSAASEAEIDKLMDERPKGKGKGGKAAPVNRLKEGPKTSVLFEHIARRLPVESRMRRWVSDWLEEADEEEADEEGGGPCVIDMFNFLLFSAGATKAYANRETELLPEVDSAEWEALMGGVVQDLREGGVPNYPLLEKSAKFKGFRERYAQAWAALVVGARDGNGHHLDALRRVLEVIHGLCECPLVSVRHTACYAGLQIGEALVKETVTLSTKIDVAARQLEAERRKVAAAGANAKGQGRKARDLERNIEEFTAHLGELEAVLEVRTGLVCLGCDDGRC